ncbi:MAG: hypothetical protein COV46_00845 [Deltaproteobacteria bacterium CG11_big_fil_rev_8_21_14_0_20_49_13]|nr:MAG: hypothetical protein COV46_00845 [Deltaproteobacteria bacterium CG11_big_fil_rev_8_21_14_0_20_49_13]
MGKAYVTKESLGEKAPKWLDSIDRKNTGKFPFDINNAVLLVIDMQRYFLEPSEHGYCPAGVAIIDNIKRLICHFRENKRPVIFTRHAHKDDGSDLGILGRWWGDMPMDGTPEAELDERLGRKPDEVAITKNRYSAFFNTNLDKILKEQSACDVVITGVMTNLCCESTARDAFFRDYTVRFMADATGAPTEEMHLATLRNLAYGFACIFMMNDILGSSVI